MARSRNIKPAYFMNEDLIEFPFITRLLFIGLWTLADREGYLEDRPKRIKMALFPADSIDIDSLLNDLASKGFVLRYSVGKNNYLHVCNFNKHQNPHHKEAASIIPKPVKESVETNQAKVCPSQAPVESEASRADPLIADPLIADPLIADPLIADPLIACKDHVHEITDKTALDAESSRPEKIKSVCEEIFQHWKNVMGYSDLAKFSTDRQKLISMRLSEGYTVNQLKTAIDGCFKSDFNMGREDGKPTLHNDIELILRDAKHIERFTQFQIALATSQTQTDASTPNLIVIDPPKPNQPSEFAKQQNSEYRARKAQGETS